MSDEAAEAPRPRRRLAIGVVATALALVGVANFALRSRDLAAGSDAVGSISPSVDIERASSVAWYCPGPLPVGVAGESVSIAVTNLGERTIKGELIVADSGAVRTKVLPVRVGPGRQTVVALARAAEPFDKAAATVLVDGGGIAVEEIITGVHGVSATPCGDRTASVEYLAAGSTLGASNLSLAVFDPGATPSVVSVSFATSRGPVSPPAFQGISLGAGDVQVLDIGHYVPEIPVVATIVNASGGRVAVGALVTAVVDKEVLSSLTTAVASLSPSWLMPAAPSGPAATNTFNVLDPGDRPAHVTLELTSSSSRSELTAVVPAGGVVALSPGSDVAAGALRSASLTSTGAPVVVDRETVLATDVVGAAELHVLAVKAAAAKAAKAAAAKAAAAKAKAAKAAAAKAAAARAAAKERAAASHKSGGHKTAVARSPGGSTTTTTSAPTTTTTKTETTTTTRTTTATLPYADVSALPELEPGVAVTSGVSQAWSTWVLPGGESDARTSEVVVIDNTTSRAVAHVRIEQLTGSGAAPWRATAFAGMPQLWVAPGSVVTVNMATVTGSAPTLPLLVSSSEPIVAGQLLYSRQGAGDLTLVPGVRVG